MIDTLISMFMAKETEAQRGKGKFLKVIQLVLGEAAMSRAHVQCLFLTQEIIGTQEALDEGL